MSKRMVKNTQVKVDLAQAKAITKLERKVSKIEKATKADVHFVDVAQTLTPGTTAAIGVLTPVAQGDGESNRDGEAISLRHISYKATLVPNAASAADSARVICFKWKSATGGVAPGAAAILEVPTNIDSPYNRDYRESLQVLFDKKIDVSNVNGTKHIKFNTMLHNSEATFISTASNHWNENHVFFLYLFTDNTNKATINYYSRVTFSP